MMVKRLVFKILVCLLSLPAVAQYSEVGLFAGGSNFIGDVGHYGFHLPTGYAFGGLYKYNFDEHWALRVQINYGHITNSDSTSNLDDRVQRNLHFKSDILEIGLLAEFNFLEVKPGTKKNHSPYIMGGVGLFSFNPRAEFQGTLFELQPLGTEGQGTSANSDVPYSRASAFFLFGFGYKFAISRSATLGIETTFRRTFTDYLDDVGGQYVDPQVLIEENENGALAAALADRNLVPADRIGLDRGNPQNTDWYIFTGVTVQFKFDELYERCASFVGRRR